MFCPRCDKEIHPVQEMREDGRMIDTCGRCGSIVSHVDKPTQIVNVAPLAKPTVHKIPTGDYRSLIETRFTELNLEIARLEGLKSEMKMLQRMLRAAGKT